MRKLFFGGLIALSVLALTACTAPPPVGDNAAESGSRQASSSQVEENMEKADESSNSDESTFPLHQIELSAYNDAETTEDVPAIEELTDYLEKTISFHGAAVSGSLELWSYKDSAQTIENTLLAAYPVSLESTGEETLFGVDRYTGTVYQWNRNAPAEQPVMVESPEVFPTPQSALEYVKDKSASQLEFIPGEPDAASGRPYPYFKSQTTAFNDSQTSTYYIEIDHLDDQSYTIHSYEVVTDSPEEAHTATAAWTTVYKNGFIVDDLLGGRTIADGAQ